MNVQLLKWNMAKKFQGDGRVQFFIGDVRDKNRPLSKVVKFDHFFYTATLKTIPPVT